MRGRGHAVNLDYVFLTLIFPRYENGESLAAGADLAFPFLFFIVCSSDSFLYVPNERSQSEHFVVLVNLMESF